MREIKAMVNYKPTVSPYKGVNFSRVDMSKLSKLSFGSQNYTNSIFTDANSSTDGASNLAKAMSFGMCFLSLAGIVGSVVSMFTSNKNSNQSKDVQETSTATTALDTAMTKADKDGDWNPVQTECNNAESEKTLNDSKIASCQSSIDKSEKTTIPSLNGEVTKLKTANDKIDNTDIPALKATKDGKIAKAETAKETSISQAKATYDAVPAMPAAVKAQAKAVYDAAVKAANDLYKQTKEAAEKEFDKAKTQKEDEKKRNNTQIEKLDKEIETENASVKEQTALKSQLENANKKLASTIQDAKDKLALHLGSQDESQKTETNVSSDKKSESTGNDFKYVLRPQEQKFDSYDWMKNDPLKKTWQNQNW